MSRVSLRVMGGTTYFELRMNADEDGFRSPSGRQDTNWQQHQLVIQCRFPNLLAPKTESCGSFRSQRQVTSPCNLTRLPQAVEFTTWLLHRHRSASSPSHGCRY